MTMSIGVTEEHRALRDAVRGWASRHSPPEVVREGYEDEAPSLPACWGPLAQQGFLGIHLDEELGGSGGGYLELAVVLEELGRAVTPGPVLPSLLASSLLARWASKAHAVSVVPGLADGSSIGASALRPDLVAVRGDHGGLRVDGVVCPVAGAVQADVLVLGATLDGDEVWFSVDAGVEGVDRRFVDSLDGSCRLGEVTVSGVEISAEQVLDGLQSGEVAKLAATLGAAEAAGVAAWCVETASEYAKVREQFGRPIGQFQGVKHRCADMLVETERARAVAWDAARAIDQGEDVELATAVAGAVAFTAATRCARSCIQVLGGIGYTWEHDAHLYFRRAFALAQTYGDVTKWRGIAASRSLDGERRTLELDLGDQGEDVRVEVRAFLDEVADLEPGEQRRRVADAGYLLPHFSPPWGRDAGAAEQLIISEEFSRAGVPRPDLVIGNWVVPTIISYGTEDQQERWVRPTFHGDITWCQMFSEPNAGSDLASLTTKASKVEGGWSINGQKVWTSGAHRADFAICLARTDPSAPKHKGITYFILDMTSEGIDIRALRNIAGGSEFNEIFLNDVFVPDGAVIGEINDGWRAARTTLANERVAMSARSTLGGGLEELVAGFAKLAAKDPVVLDRVGELVCDAQAMAVLGLRITLSQLSGVDPGAASSVRKLLGMDYQQRVSELGVELLGQQGATTEGDAHGWTQRLLSTRALTIAGGSSEVLRNIIGERMLGLPRDP